MSASLACFRPIAPGDPADPLFALGLGDRAPLRRAGVERLHPVEAARQGALLSLDHRHRDAGIGEAHGDAAPHRAGADHGGRADGAARRVVRQAGHPGGLALGEEGVAQGLRARILHQGAELGPLHRQCGVEVLLQAGAHRPRQGVDIGGVGIALHRLGGLRLEPLPGLGRELAGAVARPRQRPRIGEFQGAGPGLRHEVAEHHGVHDAERRRLLGGNRLAGEHHREGGVGPDQARQALRSPGARDNPELDLRQADPGRRGRDAAVAGHRQLQAAAEGRAADRRHHGLRAGIEPVQDVGKARRALRLAELADVGAADEHLALGGQHDGADRHVRDDLRQGLVEGRPQRGAQRVDRRVGEREHRHPAIDLLTNHPMLPDVLQCRMNVRSLAGCWSE